MNKKEASYIKKVFYTLIIGFAIICFWRGIWGLMDLYLYPNDLALSYLLSLIIGILILCLTENLIKTFISDEK